MQASEVQEETLTSFGFVVDVDEADNVISVHDSRFNFAVGEGMTCLTFHDDYGNECYLVVPDDYEIEVK